MEAAKGMVWAVGDGEQSLCFCACVCPGQSFAKGALRFVSLSLFTKELPEKQIALQKSTLLAVLK